MKYWFVGGGVVFNEKGILLLGIGKTSTALYLCMKEGYLISDDT